MYIDLDIFFNTSIKDYIIVIISVIFMLVFLVYGLNNVYKAYLGLIIGFFLLILLNLALDIGVSPDGEPASVIASFINTHRSLIAVLGLFILPIFAILMPLNKSINFKSFNFILLNGLFTIFLGLLYFPFLLSIYVGLVYGSNIFLSQNLIKDIASSRFTVWLYSFFGDSSIFGYIVAHSSIINLIIIAYILYKLTLSGFIISILGSINSKLKTNN